jgi:hypothetical protein
MLDVVGQLSGKYPICLPEKAPPAQVVLAAAEIKACGQHQHTLCSCAGTSNFAVGRD